MNIVVVTFNYRVGPYGFLAGKQVEEGGSLNNGLKDQIKALEWVQKHIHKVINFWNSLWGIDVDRLSSSVVIPTMLYWAVIVPELHLSPYCYQRTAEETTNYFTQQQRNHKVSQA